jgi:hypothetical protein
VDELSEEVEDVVVEEEVKEEEEVVEPVMKKVY